MATAAEIRKKAAQAAIEAHQKKKADQKKEMGLKIGEVKLEATPPGKKKKEESDEDDDEEEPKPKLGSGERFKKLSGKLAKKGAKDSDALAAHIGRKKYGATKMAKMAAAGRKKG